MRITRSADDHEFHDAANAVVIHIHDIVPVEGQVGTYRLPLLQRPELRTPAMIRVNSLFKGRKV